MSLKDVFLNETTGNIVRMLGFAEPVAKQFTEMNPRADFALAKSFLLWLEATYPGEPVEKKDVQRLAYSFVQWKREIGTELAELLKTKPALEKKINIAKTHEEVLDVLSSASPDEDVIPLIDVGEGWKWVQLTDRHHSKEARLMQHCATDGRGDLVSLRDPSGNPHVTMTYNKEKNTVFQIKGKQNTVPTSDYHDAIIAFFSQTKSDIKDPFVKKKDEELFTSIKKAAGKELETTNAELFVKLLKAISTPAAKQWAWDFQPYTFDNANIDYDDVQELDLRVGEVFTNAGYTSVEIEPSSGITTVYYHPSNWKRLSSNTAERIDEVPPYELVTKSWQGITMFEMAKAEIVNPSISTNVRGFAKKNHAALDNVYEIAQEIYSGDQPYDVGAAVDQECDNYITALDYDNLTGYEGSAGIGEEGYSKEKFDRRWDKFMQRFYVNPKERYGDNYYDNPQFKADRDKFFRDRQAGLEPPEE